MFVRVNVPAAGTYGVWLGGSLQGQGLDLGGYHEGRVEDRAVLRERPGRALRFGHALEGPPRLHDLLLARPATARRRSYPFGFGPLELGAPGDEAMLVTVAPAEASSLCGKELDWIEAVSGGG